MSSHRLHVNFKQYRFLQRSGKTLLVFQVVLSCFFESIIRFRLVILIFFLADLIYVAQFCSQTTTLILDFSFESN
jgi:hypothetical protein